MKKFLSILLTVAMIASMAVVSMAADVVEVASFTELKDAVDNGTGEISIKLTDDFSTTDGTITIPEGKSVNLDMNGKTITVTDTKTSNYELFYIYGEMTVTGNGAITLSSTNNREWNAMSAIFHNRGGILTIENGTFTNEGGTDMAWVVDNSGNYYGDATTNINGGTLTSSYTAIRNRMEQNSHGKSGKAILNITAGEINGDTSAIWAQAASTSTSSPATGEINISGGDIGLVNTARSAGAESMLSISGGTVDGFKVENGEVEVTGGTITGDVIILSSSSGDVEEGKEIPFASGGTFVNGIDAEYVASNAALTSNADGSASVIAYADEAAKNTAEANKGTVTFDIYPASAEVTIKKDGEVVTTGKKGDYTLPGGTYTYTVSKNGYITSDEVEFTVPENTKVSVALEADYDSEDGFGITLEGPYHYDNDVKSMFTAAEAYGEKAELEYGDSIYFLILDDTVGGAPLSSYKTVEKMKLKAEWNDGADLVEGVSIVKKYVDLENTGLECHAIMAEFVDEPGYYYFVEIATVDKDVTSESDIFGTLKFDRKANKKDGNNIEKIDGCKRNVDFTVFYPNTWLSEATIVEDKTAIEWDKEYALKFKSDDEVELTFGTSENEGTFTVDASGQSKLFLKYTTEADEAIAEANEGVKMHFLTFTGINGGAVKFNRAGEFVYEMEDAAAAYIVSEGKLLPIEGLEIEDDEFVFNTNVLSAFVFADSELVNP